MLRNSFDEFLGSVESDLNTNVKRFLSILKLNSKSHTIPDRVSTPISASAFADPGNRTPLRSSAENPREIANLFNSYFASVFVHDTPSPPPPPPSSGRAANAPASLVLICRNSRPLLAKSNPSSKPLMSRKPQDLVKSQRNVLRKQPL